MGFPYSEPCTCFTGAPNVWIRQEGILLEASSMVLAPSTLFCWVVAFSLVVRRFRMLWILWFPLHLISSQHGSSAPSLFWTQCHFLTYVFHNVALPLRWADHPLYVNVKHNQDLLCPPQHNTALKNRKNKIWTCCCILESGWCY